MTTRHAKRNGIPNGSPSANGSVEDDESRRGSLDDLRPTTSHSLGSQTSAKRRRISGTSTNAASDVDMSFESQTAAEKIDRLKSKPLSPALQQTSPTRKRKRSTPTPPYTPDVHGEITPPANSIHYQDSREFVGEIPYDDASDKESEGGSHEVGGSFLDVAQSTELTPSGTPLASEAVSPVSDESQSRIGFADKNAQVALGKALKAVEANDVDMDDAEELAEGEDLDEADELEDVDDAARADDDDRPRRRLAGRRRADHPDPDIEALMRRQLQLKSAYRSIARALKPVLAEIAQKTVEDLESNPVLHEQVVEYKGTEDVPGIQKTLDDAFARRKAQLDAQYKWNKLLLEDRREGELEVRKARCDLQFADFRQLQLDHLEHQMLEIARKAQIDEGNSGFDTEDEDGEVIPMPKRTGYRFARTHALDRKYDSRSRLALESEKALRRLELRLNMHEMLQEHAKHEKMGREPGFTVMDSTAREAALARRESIMNTNILADAASEAERVSQIPIIPNEAAIGLQMLGDLCSRPSIRATTSHEAPKSTQEAFMGAATPMQMPPPPVPPPFMPESVHERSPRMAGRPDRFNSPPPPQPFPRMEADPHAPPRNDPMLMSPIFSSRPGSLITSPAARSHEGAGRFRSDSHPLPPTPSNASMVERSSGRFERYERVHSRNHSSHSNDSRSARALSREGPPWEQYHRPLSIDRESRQPHAGDRNLHEFSASGPLSIARVEPVEPNERGPSREHNDDRAQAGSPSDHLLRMRHKPQYDPPSNPGASDSRVNVEQSPAVRHRDALRVEELAGLTDPPPVDEVEPAKDRTHHARLGSGQQDLDEEQEQGTHMQEPHESEEAAQPENDGHGDDVQREEHPHESSTKKSRSRASSIISQSTGTEATDEASAGDSGQRKSRSRGTRGSVSNKSNRGERNGLSRRLFKTGGKRHTIGSPGGPQMHRFRLNTVESTPAQSRWPGAAGAAPPPPQEYYGQTAYGGHPPPPGYGLPFGPPSYQYQYPYDHYQHRNSFPPPPPGPNGPWPPYPQTQSPLYAVPQGTQPPPPGPSGASPEPWPPIPIDPALMGPGPQSPHPPPGPQPYGPPPPPRGGANIAPATPDSRYPQLFPGGPSNHAPAFAQQQRHHEGESRKKSKSEIRGQTFKHWAPRQPRDKEREKDKERDKEQR